MPVSRDMGASVYLGKDFTYKGVIVCLCVCVCVCATR